MFWKECIQIRRVMTSDIDIISQSQPHSVRLILAGSSGVCSLYLVCSKSRNLIACLKLRAIITGKLMMAHFFFLYEIRTKVMQIAEKIVQPTLTMSCCLCLGFIMVVTQYSKLDRSTTQFHLLASLCLRYQNSCRMFSLTLILLTSSSILFQSPYTPEFPSALAPFLTNWNSSSVR